MLPRKFCFELVGSDSGIDTIRFPASDTILEVTRDSLLEMCQQRLMLRLRRPSKSE
jgi:hypothetical protein